MSDAQQVAARLRAETDWRPPSVNEMLHEAAALVEAQAAEIARWKALALKAGEALGPFADMAPEYANDDDGDGPPLVPDSKPLEIEGIDGSIGESLFTVGSFRTAAAVAAEIRSASHE